MGSLRLAALKDYVRESFVSTNSEIKYSIQRGSLEFYVNEQIATSLRFRNLLFNFLDAKGFQSDSEFYKKAGIDRRHFSKIKGNENVIPKRETVLAIAIALELDLFEAEILMNSVGYAFSNNNKTDLVVKYCIENQVYEKAEVEAALIHFGIEPLIG